MRALITFILLLASVACFSQINKATKQAAVKDSVSTVTPNSLQVEKLQQLNQQIAILQAQVEEQIQLIIGVRKEDLETLDFKDGSFIFKIKKKK